MDHLIRDLLDMASIEARRLAVERKPERVESVITEVVEVHEAAAKAKGIALVRACDTGDILVGATFSFSLPAPNSPPA